MVWAESPHCLHLYLPPSSPLRRDPARQVDACPRSINDLPEYSTDPRTPDKLLDGEAMGGRLRGLRLAGWLGGQAAGGWRAPLAQPLNVSGLRTAFCTQAWSSHAMTGTCG